MATSVAAAAAMRAEREIIDHLRRNRATSPERARDLPPLRLHGQRRLRRLLHARVVREEPAGYWLDETIYESYRSDRRAAKIALLVAVIGILIAVLLAQRA